MSTTPIESWAVDLKDVTFIYPGVGMEFIMAIIAIVLWIAWHIWQCKHESNYIRHKVDTYATEENIKKSISGG